MKRLSAILLSVLFLLTMLPMGSLAVAAEEVEVVADSTEVTPRSGSTPTLELGVPTTAVVTDKITYFTFTPEESGYYVFYSDCYEDTVAYIYDSNNHEIAYNDDGGDRNNFRIQCWLNAGMMYYLYVQYYNTNSGSFPVCLEKYIPNVITNVEFLDCSKEAHLIQRNDLMYARVTYSNGNVQMVSGASIPEENSAYFVQFAYEGNKNQWEVGGAYTVTASVEVNGTPFEGTYTVTVVESDPANLYDYQETDDGIIITYNRFDSDTVVIPSAINGKPVIGVTELRYDTEHLVLPDSVTTVGEYLFNYRLKTVSFGAGVSNLHADMFGNCRNLESITVSEDNPNFCVVDGALYDKAVTTLIAYPMGNGIRSHTVPATVTDLGALSKEMYGSLNITVADGNPYVKTVDGVTYDKGMTRVLFCDTNKAGKYVMPNTVTEIADMAFMGCRLLTEVVIAPSVTQITYFSFSECSGLQSVILPEGLLSIDMNAFSGTESLASIDLPESLTLIGPSAFYGSGLTSLKLPDATKRVESAAFHSTKIKTLDLGNGVEYLGGSVFAYTPVETVVLPDSLTYLGGSAFYRCENLRSVSIGKGLSSINSQTFGRSGLQSVVIPANIQTIGTLAFAHCEQLAQVTLSEGVRYINDGAFQSCPAITEILFPSTLYSLGEYTFSECTGLTEVVIPDNVASLGEGVFAECTSLTRAVVGDGITQISPYLFYGCPLQSIDWRGTITKIGGFAFVGSHLTSIVIPDSVTSIMYCAFEDSALLAEIDVAPTLMELGWYAFDGTAWYNAQSNGITYLEHIAYDYKGNMASNTALSIAEGTTLLADGSFAYQPNLITATLPDSLLVIGRWSFFNSENMTTLYLGENVHTIRMYAFDNCLGLTDVYYAGSEEDRAKIFIDFEGNSPLRNATWHYNVCAGNAHTYDNDCDEDCNECGLTREVPHDYTDDCDAECNGCGLTREAPHDYTDVYDAECNGCGLTRDVPEFQFGDGNGDGSINIKDLGLLQQYLNGWDVEVSAAAMDVNGDGNVNIKDLGLIQQYLNGWDVTLGG